MVSVLLPDLTDILYQRDGEFIEIGPLWIFGPF
jgi:hypothetical protein